MLMYLSMVPEFSRNKSTIDAAACVPREIPRRLLKIIEVLGSGFYGDVSKAMLQNDDGLPGYIVAVKTVKSATDTVNKQLLLREASMMAGLEHPNIVVLVGVVSATDPIMVAMEYCEHGALNKFLLKQELPPLQRLSMAGDIASGMAFLLSRGIVHRDLAARNVLVNSERRGKISDYGMSRILGSKGYYRSRGTAMSVRWTAPEALQQEIFSEQSDVWSYGITLYEIWTQGATPYEGLTERRVWIEVTSGKQLTCPALCTVDVFAIMLTCWKAAGLRPTFTELESYFSKSAESLLKGAQIDVSLTSIGSHPLTPVLVPPANRAEDGACNTGWSTEI